MMIKVIAIGNSLMGDDGIALKIVEELERRFQESADEIGLNLSFIKAETDFNFALDNIETGDFLFILDSTSLNSQCGTVIEIPLTEFQSYSDYSLSIHNMSLLSLIKHLGIQIEGVILGIEVADICFSLDISEQLKNKFTAICEEIYAIIKARTLEYLKKGETSA